MSTDPADTSDVAAATDGEVAGTVDLPDGGTLPVTLDAEIVERAEANDVDVDRLREAAVPADGTLDLSADTHRDGSATVPVQDHQETDLSNRLRRDQDHRFIEDDQIQRLLSNSVNYTERIGRFLMDRDDLIPTVKERLKALIMGHDGLTVEPSDPDDDADQRLAEHLEDLYRDDIRPGDVVDRILRENMMNARAVLRASDLKELDLNSLDYLRDGISGEEIYVQDSTTVYEFDVEDTDDDDIIPGIDLDRRTVDAQPLVIGEHVFDVALYDSPPLEAVADTAVNKMVLQRLKARKAEITSFGAVYAKVKPPSYLREEEYFDRVADDDWDGEGQPPTKLERALKSNIQSAFDTLKDFQSGTVMSVPHFWELEQLEIPETGDPLDDQIRGYNRDISRRLLVPLDLIELQDGSELSRETMFNTLMTTIAGWRQEIVRVFDRFAAAQADIEGLGDADVDHRFPPLQDANTKQIVSALQYAGVAGLSQKEVRQMLNAIQGVDLDTDDAEDADAPPAGGPDGQERTEQMEEVLEQQRRGETPPTPGDDTVETNPAEAVATTLEASADSVRTTADSDWVDFQIDFPVGDRPNLPSSVEVEDTKMVTGGRLVLPPVPKRDVTADALSRRVQDMIWDIAGSDAVDNLQARVASRPPNHQPIIDVTGRIDAATVEQLADDLPAEVERLLDAIEPEQPTATAAEHGGVDLTIPDAVQSAAQDALDARDDPDVVVNGMTDRGWTRTETLAEGGELSPEDIRGETDSMANWWSRQADDILDTTGEQTTLKSDDPDNPWADNSYTAGKGWGGVAGARFAFQKAAELAAAMDDDESGWREWVERIEAGERGTGNCIAGGDAGTTAIRQQAVGEDGTPPTGRAADILDAVPFLPDADGDGPVRVSDNRLRDWLAWVRAGRPSLEAAWNPTLHPRGPDGQFVSRPYDVPDSVKSEINELEPAEVLDRLGGTSELSDGDLEALLNDDGVRIDGVPDDVSTRKELFDVAQDDTPDDGTAMSEQGYVSPDAPDLRVGEADSVEPLLEDDEGQSGSAAKNMDVARWDDGHTAFVKRYRNTVDGSRSNGENPTNAEREVAADKFLRNIGFGDRLPALFNNDDEGYAASEKVEAATRYSEGDKVETDSGTRGVVVEIYTEPFDGPDGDEVDASDSSPAYVIATEDGAEAVTASNLNASEWSTDRDNPDDELAKDIAASDLTARLAAHETDFVETGSLSASVTDWDYPESWKESEVPARLILLDAWASMGGQFDCGGGCCKGTMMSSGMGDRASDQFCASMKDRVLMWEGWRQ